MQYVFAGNFKEFMNYCHENNLHPKKDAFFVDDDRKLWGLRLKKDDEIIRIGTYYDRQDYDFLNQYLKLMENDRES